MQLFTETITFHAHCDVADFNSLVNIVAGNLPITLSRDGLYHQYNTKYELDKPR